MILSHSRWRRKALPHRALQGKIGVRQEEGVARGCSEAARGRAGVTLASIGFILAVRRSRRSDWVTTGVVERIVLHRGMVKENNGREQPLLFFEGTGSGGMEAAGSGRIYSHLSGGGDEGTHAHFTPHFKP